MTLEERQEKIMDFTGALECFVSTASPAARKGCEQSFRSAAADFLLQLKPKAVATVCLQRQRPKRHFALSRLWRLLRHLSPMERRRFIVERLSEEERQELEQWILAERTRQGASLPTGFSTRSLCRWKGRKVGYRPILHLHDSLYAQAAFTFDLACAIRMLGILLAMRAAAEEAMTTEKMLASLSAVMQDGCASRFYFKTRVKVGHGREVATPARRNLPLALKDWSAAQLLRAEASFGRADRATREALEHLWQQKRANPLRFGPQSSQKQKRRRSRCITLKGVRAESQKVDASVTSCDVMM
ncbi:unnamed protein product [Durusdinium trenchii]|uniref:Uncharacterized protein n=2 Tax=Durusdinium trenchii TaxID=1381693 RepID=A0ABP0K4D2_9DINO